MKTPTSKKPRRPRGEKRIKHMTPAQAVEQGEGYVVFPSKALSALGPYAIKTLGVLLNQSSDFRWNGEHLRRAAGLSGYKLRIALAELRRAGYVETVPKDGKGGTKAGQDWWVTTTPNDWS